MNDVVIRGGRIVDGTGAPWFRADLAIVRDRIVEIGKVGAGRLEIQADDRVVAPGFIDMHSHSDLQILKEPSNEMKVAQGVTTEVLGQDGLSCAPLLPGHEGHVAELLAPLDGEASDWCWSGVGEYLARLDHRCAQNVAYLVPHGSLRAQVLHGDDRTARPSEIRQLRSLVAQAMSDGAFGMSTGLEYVPSRNTSFTELVELMTCAAAAGGVYVTHVRDYDCAYHEAIEEAIEVGRRTGAPVHLSHFVAWGRRHHGSMPRLLRMIESARSDGVDATFDVYPYEAGATLATYFFPDEVRMLRPDELRVRLRHPDRRAEIAVLINPGPVNVDLDWEDFTVAEGDAAVAAGGRPLTEVAQRHGKTVGELCCDLLDATDLRATFIARAYTLQDIRAAIGHRLATIGSDGSPVGDRPHPRGWGTFARIIREYVAENSWLTLESAIAKMTGRAATRLGLPARGFIRRGMAADLVLFDPAAVRDTATYERPRERASGFDLVLSNGQPVWENGAPTGLLPGRALQPQRASKLAPRGVLG